MTPKTIIESVAADGVMLAIAATGRIEAIGDESKVVRWLPMIREHKAAIIAALKVGVTEGNPCGSSDTATASRWWLLHYLDCDPVEMACCPEATHAEILERHPDAAAAEPFTPTLRQPSAPLTASEETAIRAWLALIEENDQVIIAEVIDQCQQDADARSYFTGRAAAELPKPDTSPDDRRTCEQCVNLIARRCQAAKRGEIVASRNYEPIRDQPQRCEGFAPHAEGQDISKSSPAECRG